MLLGVLILIIGAASFIYREYKYQLNFSKRLPKIEPIQYPKDQKFVTMGCDLKPTILTEDGKIYPRRAELIFHSKYYPKGIETKWAIDPKTGKKLPIKPIN